MLLWVIVEKVSVRVSLAIPLDFITTTQPQNPPLRVSLASNLLDHSNLAKQIQRKWPIGTVDNIHLRLRSVK